ncbi:MAG: hypothetical protein FJ296_02490, partial [Planctomycetes bacterium]|nr:hypothetical protein [Planctomycetota bacterium]
MSLLTLGLTALLALPLQHAAPAPAAQAVSATEHGSAGAPAEPELGAADIFMGLFKHLEPHAVTALWLGGNQGLSLV